jgi:hypothetical protein
MSEREKIMARLAKMKALAERGVGGESINAAHLMEAVAAKYGIDLDSIEADAESMHRIEELTGWKMDLMQQLAGLMRIERYGSLNAERCAIYTFSKWDLKNGKYQKNGTGLKCTDAEFVELQAKFAVLSRDYEQQKKAFFRAFLEANDLLAPAGSGVEAMSKEKLEEARTASRLAIGIKKSNLHKQLEATCS